MIFFYETKSTRIKNGVIKNVTCPHCETNTDIRYSVFGRYAYLYGIPLFPVGKKKILECNKCKATYNLKDLSDIKQKFASEQKQNSPKTLKLHFIVPIVIGLLIIIMLFISVKGEYDSKKFSENPKIGDVYFKITSSGKYSICRVTSVTKDSVFVLLNNKEIEKEEKLNTINIDSNFTTKTAGYSRQQIIDFYKNGKSIYRIQRENKNKK